MQRFKLSFLCDGWFLKWSFFDFVLCALLLLYQGEKSWLLIYVGGSGKHFTILKENYAYQMISNFCEPIHLAPKFMFQPSPTICSFQTSKIQLWLIRVSNSYPNGILLLYLSSERVSADATVADFIVYILTKEPENWGYVSTKSILIGRQLMTTLKSIQNVNKKWVVDSKFIAAASLSEIQA